MALLSGLRKTDAGSAANGDVVKDSNTQNFMTDVIEASRDHPVVVDFWAPWCGPCKQLTPVLERVVRAAGGKVRLVKINVDENPELAQQLRIQSLPMVYGFYQGQPVDGFAGAQQEGQIKAFVERLAGPVGQSPVETALDQAKGAVAAGQMDAAGQLYERVLQAEPGNPDALAGAARCQIATGRLAAAREILAKVPTEHTNHVEVDGARAALSLAEEAGTLPDAESLSSRLQSDPSDHAARLDLATGLFLRGQIEGAIDELLSIVRKDRKWQDEAARKQLIKCFEALGPNHPATVAGRRKLSAVLFS